MVGATRVAKRAPAQVDSMCHVGEWVPPPAMIRGVASLLPPGDWRGLRVIHSRVIGAVVHFVSSDVTKLPAQDGVAKLDVLGPQLTVKGVPGPTGEPVAGD